MTFQFSKKARQTHISFFTKNGLRIVSPIETISLCHNMKVEDKNAFFVDLTFNKSESYKVTEEEFFAIEKILLDDY